MLEIPHVFTVILDLLSYVLVIMPRLTCSIYFLTKQCLTICLTNQSILGLGYSVAQISIRTDCLLKLFGRLWSRHSGNIICSLSFKERTGFSTIYRMTEICSQIRVICYATLDKSHNLSICFPICPLYIIISASQEIEHFSYENSE